MMVGITGPMLEEVLFRGIILDGFLKRYQPGKAIFWSAFLFGLIPPESLAVYSWIYHWNDPWIYILKNQVPYSRLFSSHIVNNSFSYLIMYIYGEDVTSFLDLFQEKGDYYLFLGDFNSLWPQLPCY